MLEFGLWIWLRFLGGTGGSTREPKRHRAVVCGLRTVVGQTCAPQYVTEAEGTMLYSIVWVVQAVCPSAV